MHGGVSALCSPFGIRFRCLWAPAFLLKSISGVFWGPFRVCSEPPGPETSTPKCTQNALETPRQMHVGSVLPPGPCRNACSLGSCADSAFSVRSGCTLSPKRLLKTKAAQAPNPKSSDPSPLPSFPPPPSPPSFLHPPPPPPPSLPQKSRRQVVARHAQLGALPGLEAVAWRESSYARVPS